MELKQNPFSDFSFTPVPRMQKKIIDQVWKMITKCSEVQLFGNYNDKLHSVLISLSSRSLF